MVIEEFAQQFAIVQVEDVLANKMPVLAALVVELLAPNKIHLAQEDDLELQDLIDRTKRGEAFRFYLTEGGTLKTSSGKMVIPNDAKLRIEILMKLIKYDTLFIPAIIRYTRI
jgi:hypothetical protein